MYQLSLGYKWEQIMACTLKSTVNPLNLVVLNFHNFAHLTVFMNYSFAKRCSHHLLKVNAP